MSKSVTPDEVHTNFGSFVRLLASELGARMERTDRQTDGRA